MAEELFKGLTPAKTATAVAAPADASKSGPTNVTPPAEKVEGEGDKSQTTQSPEDGKQAPSSSGSSEGTEAVADDEEDDGEGSQGPSELDLLKRRATLMNIQFSNNIGVNALKAKIQAALDGEAAKEAEAEAAEQAAAEQAAAAANQKKEAPVVAQTASTNALTGNETKPVKKQSLRQYLVQEKMKLVRVRITNLDPKKKDLPGEIITVANEHLGTVRKFVPFGEVTDNGYHIPKCIYDMLKERTFVSIKTRKDSKGQTIVEHQNAREFSLEVLEPLTADELAKLAASQSAAGGL